MRVWDANGRDYFWFYEEWNVINTRFVKKFGKRLQDMLMELQYMHRVKLENKVVMDNVKRMSDVILPDDVSVFIILSWSTLVT